MGWRSFIERAGASEHAVQVYDGLDELTRSVGAYLAAGFGVGEPAIVIASAAHRRAFETELDARGVQALELEDQGILTCRDADETLAAFMDGGMPSSDRFEDAVGRLVDEVSSRFPTMTIRAFGEMVDILWARGEKEAALALEELWSDLARSRRFALLCGYRLDIFDIDVQTGALPAVFGAHSHAQPAHDTSRLADAVDTALTEIVGPIDAAHIYLDVAADAPLRSLPRGQAVLAWLCSNDAALAESVLGRARRHYAGA